MKHSKARYPRFYEDKLKKNRLLYLIHASLSSLLFLLLLRFFYKLLYI